jgi:hypothetical protein
MYVHIIKKAIVHTKKKISICDIHRYLYMIYFLYTKSSFNIGLTIMHFISNFLGFKILKKSKICNMDF